MIYLRYFTSQSGGQQTQNKTNTNCVLLESEDYNHKCAPGVPLLNGSCFSLDALVRIAKAYNKKTQNHSDQINLKNCPKNELYNKIQDKMNKFCKNEECWIEQNFIQKNKYENYDLLELVFKPKKPKGQFTWLTTTDIYKVLKQYERSYPDFEFIATVPIDFDQFFTEICKLNLRKFFKNNKKRFGIVFNLDPHYKSGSHWVSLFVDFTNNDNDIYYFDSGGVGPPPEVQELMGRFAKKAQKLGIQNITQGYNKTQHQQKNSECGVYCIYFILNRLKGNKICQRLSDEEVNKYRAKFFR